MSGCSGLTVSYLQFRNTGGIFVGDSNYSGINILHNQFLGLPSSIGGASNASAAVYLAGNLNTTAQNLVVEYNTFGDANSCTAVFYHRHGRGRLLRRYLLRRRRDQQQHHPVQHLPSSGRRDPLPQICSGCATGTNVSVWNGNHLEYNYFFNWHRIAVEFQGSVNLAVNYFQHNVILDPISPSYGTFGLSEACCISGLTAANSTGVSPSLITYDNLIVTNVNHTDPNFSDPPFGIEFWGNRGAGNQQLDRGRFWQQHHLRIRRGRMEHQR